MEELADTEQEACTICRRATQDKSLQADGSKAYVTSASKQNDGNDRIIYSSLFMTVSTGQLN